MNLTELIGSFRRDIKDTVVPYIWSDVDVTAWINEAETEAAIRAGLLFDASTPAYCDISVVAGTRTYTLNDVVNEVTRVWLEDGAGERAELALVTEEQIERDYPDWREGTATELDAVIHRSNTLELGTVPTENGTLRLEVYRGPAAAMVAGGDSPEIALVHHRHLIKWAMYRAFSVPDTDGFDPNRSASSMNEFEEYFGPHPGQGLRKSRNASRTTWSRFAHGLR